MSRSRAVAQGALALLSLALHGRSARAQSETAARAVSFDSMAVVEQLRKAQRHFERLREANAPTLAMVGGGCDVRVSAYCARYHAPNEDVPAEPGNTDQARAELIDALADGARILPGDPWIAGQRVRYLVDHHRPGAASAAAQECRAAPWWCAALEAFALHAQADDAGADSLFAEAIAAMPAAERCAWTDLSLAIDDQPQSYAKLPCNARQAANLRFWWLGQPLYMRPGNDLRAEHYSRYVMARILSDAGLDRPLKVKGGLFEIIVRYGWPIHWLRAPRRAGDAEPGALITRMRSPSWHFFPSTRQPPSWQLEPLHPASLYAPIWAAMFSTIDHTQIARFRRGDSSVTVAGFDVSTDTTLAGEVPRVALAVGTDAASPVIVSQSVMAARGAVAVQSADPPAIVSLEAVHDGSHWAARLRSAMADPSAWLTSPLSDILLVQAEAANSGAVAPLTAVALTGPSLPVGRPVGLYWEWYERPAAGAVLAIEARVARIGGKGPPDPLGHSECVPAGKAAMAVQWRDSVGTHPSGVGRAVALDLTRLKPGRYLIAISVGVEGVPDAPRCTSREIELAGR